MSRIFHFIAIFIYSIDLRKFNFPTAVMQTGTLVVGKVISLKNQRALKKKKSELKTRFFYCLLEIQINSLQPKLNIFQKWSSLSLYSLEHVSAERSLAISILEIWNYTQVRQSFSRLYIFRPRYSFSCYSIYFHPCRLAKLLPAKSLPKI